MPRFEADAIRAGGLSGLGSRAGVEAAELQRGQSQLLADIEAKGLQSSFMNAQQQFAQQKAVAVPCNFLLIASTPDYKFSFLTTVRVKYTPRLPVPALLLKS